jgi:hypothetical protein
VSLYAVKAVVVIKNGVCGDRLIATFCTAEMHVDKLPSQQKHNAAVGAQ